MLSAVYQDVHEILLPFGLILTVMRTFKYLDAAVTTHTG